MNKRQPGTGITRYLQTVSVRSLESFELSRLDEAARVRRDMIDILDRLVEVVAEAKLARIFIEQRKPLAAPAQAEEIMGEVAEKLLPGKVALPASRKMLKARKEQKR